MGLTITDETPFPDLHSRGTGSIVTERPGYILRTRGEHNRLVRHDYRCPVHGVFETIVPSGDVPDEVKCRHMVDGEYRGSLDCGKHSPWQAPSVGQGWAAGTVKT